MTISTSLLELLIAAALKATLLLAIAAIVERTLLRRHASAAARHLLWTFTLVGALLLPAFSWTLPGLDIDFPVIQLPASFQSESPAATPASVDARGAFSDEASPAAAESDPVAPAVAAPVQSAGPAAHDGAPGGSHSSATPVRWADLLVAAYLLGALLLLARVAIEQLVVRRLSRKAVPADDAEWRMLLQSLTGVLGVRRRVSLVRSHAATMPLTWGVIRPFVMVPFGADEWPPSRRRAVLLHELAHVARYDCLTQTLAAITCALYWPHPGMWWAAGRLRVERELACDDQALLGGVHPRDYAGHLLAIARTFQAPRALTTLVVSMASTSHLELRIRAAIDGRRARRAPDRRAAVSGALLTAALLLPLGAIRGEASGAGQESRAGSAPEAERAESSAAPADWFAGTPGASAGGEAEDASAPALPRGEWTMRLARRGEGGQPQGEGPLVHVALRAPGLNTFYVGLTRLEGLTTTQIRSPEATVRFQLREDAGTFTFDGSFRNGRGTGVFEFAPDPAFGDALVRRGIQRPTLEQQFEMARHDVDLVFVDELAEQGYALPSPAALVKVGMTGVDLRYLREMNELGYRLGTLEALIGIYNGDVTPEYIREMAALGYRRLSLDDLRRMRDQDVGVERVREMNSRAGMMLSIEELVEPRTRGRTTAASPASTPLEGRWAVHGVQGASADLELFWTDQTNWRRRIATAELRGISADEMASQTSAPASFRIEQDAGTFEFEGSFRVGRGTGDFRFRPARGFLSSLRSLGVRGIPELTDHHLKNFAYGGVGAAEIREFMALGFAPLAFGDAISMAIYQVTPEYARGMQSLGVADANTVQGLVDMRIFGVSLEYARELASLGYVGLSGSELVGMRRGGVTPDFIRRVREAGYRDVSPDLLIEMWRRGIDETARREGLRRSS